MSDSLILVFYDVSKILFNTHMTQKNEYVIILIFFMHAAHFSNGAEQNFQSA